MQEDNSYFDELKLSPANEKWFAINWCITTQCNFKCSYCHPSLNSGDKQPVPTTEILNFIEDIGKQREKKQQLFVQFTGGEVTLLRDFPEIAKKVAEYGKTSIISNGSVGINWWKKNLSYLSQVFLSYHHEFSRTQNFIETCQLISSSQDHFLHVNMMMIPESFDECLAIAETIKNTCNCTISLQPLVDNFGTSSEKPRQNYSVGQIQIMRDFKGNYRGPAIDDGRSEALLYKASNFVDKVNVYDLIIKNQNKFQGYHCYAGIDQITIDSFGNIYRGWCKEGGKIGSVRDPSFRIPKRPVLCSKKSCDCAFDIHANKKEVQKNVPAYLSLFRNIQRKLF